ncbi:phosphoribosyltransferase [Myxacorys almedinensis]|uniref:Phosphoribosyltransferase n=1 Tax=Myxacorys almedinensis A TaxID=2690445 RepID=A0A8J7YWB9_9CYAN|nr:phosphoribosyltransferase family protein [Myxacorys almedinensis]NDJ15867.1 phosphoribosyltransferase [Myxacorys almedinensis A]
MLEKSRSTRGGIVAQVFRSAENPILFVDRDAAGEQLAQAVLREVQTLREPHQFVVYGLPRGGVPVALPVARSLGCPLEVLVAKKITRPTDPELAIGAVTADGQVLRTAMRLSIHPDEWQEAVELARIKAQQQLAQFSQQTHRGAEATLPEQGSDQAMNAAKRRQIALLVDDGIATGMTITVAAKALRQQNLDEIWICAPVAPEGMIKALKQWCDRTVILATPDPFFSVSRFYQSFPQLSTEEALAYLKKSTQA